jgi:hypothetical protein
MQPELLFIQKGEQYQAGGVVTKAKLNYLELPVLAKISFGSESVKGYVNAGPSLTLGLTGKQTVEGGPNAGETDIRFGDRAGEGRRYLDNRFDFGLQLVGGPALGQDRVRLWRMFVTDSGSLTSTTIPSLRTGPLPSCWATPFRCRESN